MDNGKKTRLPDISSTRMGKSVENNRPRAHLRWARIYRLRDLCDPTQA